MHHWIFLNLFFRCILFFHTVFTLLDLPVKLRIPWLMNVTCDVLTFKVVSEGNVRRGDHLAWLTGSCRLQLRPSDLGRA